MRTRKPIAIKGTTYVVTTHDMDWVREHTKEYEFCSGRHGFLCSRLDPHNQVILFPEDHADTVVNKTVVFFDMPDKGAKEVANAVFCFKGYWIPNWLIESITVFEPDGTRYLLGWNVDGVLKKYPFF